MRICARKFGKSLTSKLALLFSAAFVTMFILNPVARAQETGQITGVVSDTTGAALQAIVVTATNTDTNASRTATTNSTGTYSFIGLPPAVYQISTPGTGGFQGYKAKAEVTVGGKLTFDIKLSLGSASTTVEVSAEGGTQVNTQTQDLSQVVDRQQVSQLPSLTRNPYDFVALSGNISAGDNTAAGKSQNGTQRGVGYSLNGQRSTGTEILLDGVENIAVFSDGVGITVPVDTVQEFSVTTSNFLPQYGRASGGIVNVTTRTGTNKFHGSAWEFNRLSAYTANTETNDAQGLAKGTYTRNQFGAAVGGPILKDKLFFFGSTEFTRVRSSASLTAAVPTPQFLATAAPNVQAYFNSYGGNQNFNFLSTSTNQQIGAAQTTPGQTPTLLYPNLPASLPVLGVVGYQAPTDAGGGLPQNTYNITGRVDYNFGEKTQAFFRYVDYSETDTSGANFWSPYSQYDVGGTVKNQAYLLSVAHEFNAALSSITKLSFSRFDTTDSYNTALQNTPTLFTYVNAVDPVSGNPINLPGFYNQNPADGGLPFGGPQNTVQINEDLSLVKGKHSAQFGTQIEYIQANNAYGAYAQASEQLGNSPVQGLQNLQNGDLFRFTAAVNPNGAVPCVANQYTGTYTQTPSCSINLPATQPSFARSDRFHDWAVYAQDAWKMSPKATINYGVRYEYFGVQHNNNPNLDSNFFFGGDGTATPANIRTGQVLTSPNSPVHGLWAPQYGTVSPRLGFAYDVFGDGKSAIRGGYGISYERNFGNVTFNVIQNPPSYAVIIQNNTTVTSSNAGPLAAASGNVALPPTSLRNVSQNIRTAQTQFWSLAVEQQLAPNTVVSLEYTGSRGLHLYDIKNYNGLGSGNALLGDPVQEPGTSGDNAVYNVTRLNPQFSDINNRGSNGDSYYHGMNVKFESRNLHHTGLSFVANYTLAHETDDISTTFSETNNAFSLGYTDPFNPSLDHGNGDFDIRNRFVFAPIYKTPQVGSQRGLLNQAFGGWQVSGIYTARSGTPFSYFDTTNNYSGYNVARYTPANGVVPQHTFKGIPGNNRIVTGPNVYQLGQLPAANSFANAAYAQVDPADYPNGISDWGPFPADMTARNAFRGPGAWNLDAALTKTFPIREQLNIEFRAEGFDVLNHHNLYILAVNNNVQGGGGAIEAQKGGVAGGANDERRFGQFALKVNF
jgi:Carboxypeptidase regulatory-like domain/TonB dependent receptor